MFLNLNNKQYFIHIFSESHILSYLAAKHIVESAQCLTSGNMNRTTQNSSRVSFYSVWLHENKLFSPQKLACHFPPFKRITFNFISSTLSVFCLKWLENVFILLWNPSFFIFTLFLTIKCLLLKHVDPLGQFDVGNVRFLVHWFRFLLYLYFQYIWYLFMCFNF